MHRTRLVTAVVALAVAAGCGSGGSSDDDPPDDPTAEAEGATVDLDVTVETVLGTGRPSGTAYPPQADGLIADYTVTNNSDGPVLVVERRPDVPTVDVGIPLPDTEESTWVYADDGVIQVTKEMFPVTDDRERGEPYAVPARRVHAGESITGRAFALTPLRGIVPQSDAFNVPGSAELPTDGTTWRFCVQVAPDPETRDDAIIFDYTPDRRLLCSDEAELPSGALVSLT